jgi:diguanylate cyclase (GGDEF)-like protein
VLCALAAVPFVVPLLSDEWRIAYGQSFIYFPFLAVLLVSIRVRVRTVTDPTERRFWNLLTFGFACWLGALLGNMAATVIDSRAISEILNNVPYLLFYGAIALAIEVPPYLPSSLPRGRLRVLDRIGAMVLLFGMLMYFLVLPGLVRAEAFWGSSLALFFVLDVYIILRLANLRRATPDAEWRAVYSWLLVGAALWGIGDLGLMLMWDEVLTDPGYGTLFDLLWPVALGAVTVATRVPEPPPRALPAVAPVRGQFRMGQLVVYAVVPPILHLAFYRFASPSAEVGPARELLVLGFAMVLAAMTLAYQRLLQAENRQLVREEESARENLAHLAFHDELTGLPNREMFQDHLRLAIADAMRYRRRCAVLFCDLDHFKAINDSLGHEAGDQVLISSAERLRSTVRVLDTVARFGGDEFTIILHGISGPLDAARLAENMLEALSEPLLVQGKKHVVTSSVGIAVFPEDGGDEAALLKHADIAMYQAKVQGGNNYRMFTEAMNAAAEERLAIEQGLRIAHLEEKFVVVYQAIVGIDTAETVGYEALLRWNHPDRGLIAPGSFLDVAEQTGLIVPIGKWVLETACRWAVKLDPTSTRPPSIAVNMSARQLQEATVVGDVMAIVESTGLDPRRLNLEITESLAFDTESTVPVLSELRDHGVHIAVDHFGTGFAALSRLAELPVDLVKIDRSFVRGIEVGSVGETIVRAIVTMARALKFYVVAEGVETETEFNVVKELGCDAVQGFFLHGPMLPEDIEKAME